MLAVIETAIAAIHAKIDTENSPATLPYKIGKRYIRAKDAPPRVVWTEGKAPIKPTRRAGGNPAEIGIYVANLDAHIWQTTLEAARASMHDIMAAARHEYAGPLIVFTGYDPMEDGSVSLTSLGEGFVLHLQMRIKLAEFTGDTVTVTQIDGTAVAELPAGDETYTTTTQT